MSTRTFWKADLSSSKGPDDGRVQVSEDEANLVSSLCDDGLHMPVLDFDVPHRLVPSTTEDHSHLYVDVPTEWSRLKTALAVLADCGIIQQGFCDLSIMRGACFVRKPGIFKLPSDRVSENF